MDQQGPQQITPRPNGPTRPPSRLHQDPSQTHQGPASTRQEPTSFSLPRPGSILATPQQHPTHPRRLLGGWDAAGALPGLPLVEAAKWGLVPGACLLAPGGIVVGRGVVCWGPCWSVGASVGVPRSDPWGAPLRGRLRVSPEGPWGVSRGDPPRP